MTQDFKQDNRELMVPPSEGDPPLVIHRKVLASSWFSSQQQLLWLLLAQRKGLFQPITAFSSQEGGLVSSWFSSRVAWLPLALCYIIIIFIMGEWHTHVTSSYFPHSCFFMELGIELSVLSVIKSSTAEPHAQPLM